MSRSPMRNLLEQHQWNEYQPDFDQLRQWSFYPLLLQTLEELKQEELFVSHMHGLGHIERTILQGGFCAMDQHLSEADTRLLLAACSYHDVGRINDWVDDLHGHRSAQQLARLTPYRGEELLLIQGAVDAHSRRDVVLEATIDHYGAADRPRAIRLAKLLKDADGLDRARLGDLDPKYLRFDTSRTRVKLAEEVYAAYQISVGNSPAPFFTKEQVASFRAKGEKPGKK